MEDHIFELLLEFFSVHAHSIAFPEIALPAVVRVSAYSVYVRNYYTCCIFHVANSINREKSNFNQVCFFFFIIIFNGR